MIWRWVRDRLGGWVHAVPADFHADTWYAVCLNRVTASTAVEGTYRHPRVCSVCLFTVRQMQINDQHAEPDEPTPSELAADYLAGASLDALSVRHRISVYRVKRKLDAAGVRVRTREQARRVVFQNGLGA